MINRLSNNHHQFCFVRRNTLMDITDIIGMVAKQPQVMNVIASQFGLDSNQAGGAVNMIMKALAGGVQNNVQQSGGLDALMGALDRGNHAQYLDNPNDLSNATEEGNKVLGHVLGSKDVSRQLASNVEQQTGVGADIIKKMLPLIAMTMMGSMSKNRSALGASAFAGGVASLLDRDGDGNPLDDVLKMVANFR
jgi:hypothetical protein